MKILKTIFYVILGLIALIFVVALFLPSEYKVERSVEINKPVGIVFGYVADFNNFREWNPWSSLEPNHSFEVSGDSGQVGQKYHWDGNIIGTGEMIFTELKPYELIKSDILFLAPEQANGVVDFIFDGEENRTKISWSLTGSADYPLGRFFGLMMDSFLGPDFEKGMINLKNMCESKEIQPAPKE
jgi:Polyketide cyclase / dehydrase and lipid transport